MLGPRRGSLERDLDERKLLEQLDAAEERFVELGRGEHSRLFAEAYIAGREGREPEYVRELDDLLWQRLIDRSDERVREAVRREHPNA